ncbi:20383_t:CDS:2, partial [Racocetra persica]
MIRQKKAVEIEEYNRNKGYNKQNDPTLPDATSNTNQEDQLKHNQVENLIWNIVNKMIKVLNKKPTQPHTNKLPVSRIEFTEIGSRTTNEYLKVKLLDNSVGYDVKPV